MSPASQSTRKVIYSGLVWAESPRWRDGMVWVSDTQASRLVEVGGSDVRGHHVDGPINGTAFLTDGALIGARMAGARVDRYDGGQWTTYADLSPLGVSRLGDLTAADDDSVYVGDPGPIGGSGSIDGREAGRLLRIDPTGNPSVAAEQLNFPNGLALIEGGSTLIVAESFANRLTAFTVGPGGGLSDRRPWVDLGRAFGPDYHPDGLWPCRNGSVWVATMTGEAFVRVFEGEVVERLDVDGFAIACCLDDDERELYVTVANSIDPYVPVLEAVADRQVRARVERYDHLEP
jgi:sugar lactone lactonase YvrE